MTKKKVCYWLDSSQNGTVAMRAGRIYACCTRAVPILADKTYYYDELSYNDIQKNRIALFEAINNGNAPQCEGCNCLVEKEENEIDIGKIGYLIYHPHTTCNLKCNYCFFQSNEQDAKLDIRLTDLYSAVKNFHEIGLLKEDFSLEIGGGEPLLMNNIDKTIRFLEEFYPKSTLVIVSNFTLTDKVNEIIKSLENRKIKTVLKTSLDCGTKETFKVMKQHDLYDNVVNNLVNAAKNAAFDLIYLKYILLEDGSNTDEKNIEGFIDLCKKIKDINKNETRVIIDADMRAFTEDKDYFKTDNSDYLKLVPKHISFDMLEAARNIYHSLKNYDIQFDWHGDRLSSNSKEGQEDVADIIDPRGPLVSIFLPYYNDKKFLGETIQSILNQTYKNFELILFNHKSTDGSRDIAHSFSDPRIKHFDAEENLGAGSGLNSYNLLNEMNGKYIKFFCADDVMEPNCIEESVKVLENNQNIGFAVSDAYFIDEQGNRQQKLWSDDKKEIGFNLNMDEKDILKMLFMRHSPIPFPSGIIRKNILKPEYLDKSYIHLFDVNLWANLIIGGAKLKIIAKPLMSYRISSSQITSIIKDVGTLQTSFFEVTSAQGVFYKVKDYDLLKAMCPESQYINEISPNDIWAFEFIVAHYMLTTILGQIEAKRFASYLYALQICAYQKLHDLLEDDETRLKLKEKFNFGVKELRYIYTYVDKQSATHLAHSIKQKLLYNKSPKELNIFALSFLMMRQMYNFVTLRTFKDYMKKRKSGK